MAAWPTDSARKGIITDYMKRLSLLALLLVAFAAFGCNGSSDNDNGPGGGGRVPGLTPGPRIEAVALDSDGGFVDPMNIEVNERIQFQLVDYSANGNRQVLVGEEWLSDDISSTFGRLANNTGLFIASDRSGTEPIGISVSYQGRRYSTRYQVRDRVVRLSGNVFVQGSGTPVYGVVIEFFDDQRLLVGSTRTQIDGSFRAIVPSRAVSFQILNASLPTEVHRSFLFNGDRYDTGRATCRAPFFPFENGIRFLDTDILLAPNNGRPAPEPTGCSLEDSGF